MLFISQNKRCYPPTPSPRYRSSTCCFCYRPPTIGGVSQCLNILPIAPVHSPAHKPANFWISASVGFLPPHIAGFEARRRACLGTNPLYRIFISVGNPQSVRTSSNHKTSSMWMVEKGKTHSSPIFLSTNQHKFQLLTLIASPITPHFASSIHSALKG